MVPTRRVGVVMQPVRTYCRGVLRGLASVSNSARWDCVLIPTDEPLPIPDMGGFVHGFIGHFSEKALLDHVERAGVPAVDISPARPDAKLPAVRTDELAVGRLAAAHLLALGLPHFGFCGSRSEHVSLLRGRGFKQALAAAGRPCHVFSNGPAAGAGEAAPPGATLEEWVSRLPKPVGILASTDGCGFQILAVCKKLGVAVPGSVALIGVDNEDVFCDLANPTLSSIALSTQRIGYEAARMLERLMAGETPAERQLLVPPAGVVPRGSSDVPAILDPDVAAAVRYISLHVEDDLQVADLLREIPVSRRSLEYRFIKALGRTPAAEIRRAQVEVAKQILTQTDEPMARVALAAGFSNAKQFGLTFHHETGVTPTAYRRRPRGR